ncbi:MAG: GNAT family N-acetyltransferase [Sphaerochaeta sp.]|nr:GNAT family N-acetyltransferase [Sphaerochaeta sp.]
MIISEYESTDSNWNEIVTSFKHYSVFDIREYQLASCQNKFDKPVLLLFEHEEQRAMITFLVRDVADDSKFSKFLDKQKYYDISSVYGYGGMVSDSDFYPVSEYFDYCKDQGYIAEFVRFNLFSKYKDNYLGKLESRSHNVVVNLEQSIESIFKSYDRKVRKNIQTAVRNNLIANEDPDFQFLDEFLRIYHSTMERNNASNSFNFPREYFEAISQMRKQNASLFHVMMDDQIISSELVLYDNNCAYSFLGGTDSNYFTLRPNELLKDYIIKWAHSQNLNKFVLGGGYGEDDGIFNYKKYFSKDGIFPFYIGKSIFDQEKYTKLCELRMHDNNFIPNSSFFPLYRA